MRLHKFKRRLAPLASIVAASIVGTVVVAGPAYASYPAGDGSSYPTYGPYSAEADIDGRGSMNVNDRIKTNAYVTGGSIYLVCQDTGPSYGGSTIWDYTQDGYWIPDAYVKTGTSGFVSSVPRCISIGINGYSSEGSVEGEYTAEADIDGRGSMNPDDRVKYDAYLTGNQIYVECQDNGPSYGGSTIWDYTADGYWVPDAYVKTGYSGMVPGMPTCSSLGINGGGATNTSGGERFVAATDLNGYSAKSLSSSYKNNAYLDGSYLTVMCQAYGEYNYGGSAIWDYTAQGYWVADYYVHTGSSTFVMRRCDNDSPSGSSGNRFLAETTLNGYNAKSLTSTYVNDKYPGGSYITVVCQAYGAYNYSGSYVWDKTSDGLWVADYYVKTGATDIIMTRCDNDPAPSGGGYPTAPGAPAPGSVPASQMRDVIVNAVSHQIGVHEWGDNCNPYGPSGTTCGEPWCSIFASWAFRQAGIDVNLPYSGDFYYWAQRHGTLRSLSDIRPGDLVLFGSGPSWPNSNHVGVVVDVQPDGAITTVEGNFHNEVTEVGPYQVSDAATYHPGDGGIFAAVAPTNDGLGTVWDSDYNKGDSAKIPVCSQDLDNGSSHPFYACVQMEGDQARAIVIAQPSSTKAFGASVTLSMGGSAVSTARCITIYGSGYRTCETPWKTISAQTFTADADITVNGSAMVHQHALMMKLVGYQQTAGDYCGPASTQAALGTMGYAMPSQDTLANEEQTTFYNFTIPTNIPASLNSRVSGGGYKALWWDNSGESELYQLEDLRLDLESGRDAILLVNPNNLPADWNIETGAIVRHYIMIYGYGGEERTVIDGVPYDFETFNVWDPANNVTHTMNTEQLATYTTGADFGVTGDPGTFLIIAK